MKVETEIRSLISEGQYNRLLAHFRKHAELVKEDYQETFYFDCREDLRIQRNSTGAKVWMKKGKLHDDQREEIEVQCSREEFENLERLFYALGYGIRIKWYRNRVQFTWGETKVCLDHTKGFGYVIELERMCSQEEAQEVHERLTEQMRELGVQITPKEEFEKRFNYYKDNWRSLVGEE